MNSSQKLGVSSILFSLMTFISRILGYVRDMLAAYFFGASTAYDAFIIAFRLPNLLRRLFAEGAFSQAFVPVLSESFAKDGDIEAQKLISKVATNLFFVLLFVTVVGIVFSDFIISIFAFGFTKDPQQFYWASLLLKVTFPYILLVSLTAFCGAVLNCKGRFAEAAFTPALLNLAMIGSMLFLYNKFSIPVMSLAIGVIIGGVLQLCFLLPRLYRLGLLPQFDFDWKNPSVRKILRLMSPAIVGSSAGQLNSLVDSFFASLLVSGSISWLYFADRLMELPLGVFGVAFATVLLPKLSKAYARGDEVSYQSSVDWGLRSVLLVGVPSALGLYILAEPILATLFMSGKFVASDVRASSEALKAYSFAIVGIMLTKVLASAFYARQDIATAVRVSLFVVIENILLNALLISYFQHVGLAIATSIASFTNAGILLFILVRRSNFNFCSSWNYYLFQILLGCLSMTAVLLLVSSSSHDWLAATKFSNLTKLFFDIAIASCAYFVTLIVTGGWPRKTLISRA